MYLYVDWFKADGEEVSGGDDEETDINYSFSSTSISASIGVDAGQFTVRPAVAGE